MSTVTLSNAGISTKTSLFHRLENDDLPCSKECSQVVIAAPETQEQCMTLSYPYSLIWDDNMPDTLGDCYTSGSYAWDSRAMRVVSVPVGFKPAFSVCLHSSVKADVESSAKNVNKVLSDDDVTEKKVAARPFDP